MDDPLNLKNYVYGIIGSITTTTDKLKKGNIICNICPTLERDHGIQNILFWFSFSPFWVKMNDTSKCPKPDLSCDKTESP